MHELGIIRKTLAINMEPVTSRLVATKWKMYVDLFIKYLNIKLLNQSCIPNIYNTIVTHATCNNIFIGPSLYITKTVDVELDEMQPATDAIMLTALYSEFSQDRVITSTYNAMYKLLVMTTTTTTLITSVTTTQEYCYY